MNIISYSGGKDSTAMLLMMIDKGININEVVFCDTGLEWDEVYQVIDRIDQFLKDTINISIIRLRPKYDFEYYLAKFQKGGGKYKHIDGLGWPGHLFRWCTGKLKTDIFNKYVKKYDDKNIYIGIAYDERKRIKRKHNKKRQHKYPLVKWRITEQQALTYCQKRGYNWGGLYKHFKRLSCWLCPLQGLNDLKYLFNHYPEKWEELKRLDRLSFRDYRTDYTVDQLEEKFRIDKNGLFELAK